MLSHATVGPILQRDKFQPLIEASPALAAKKPKEADRYKNLQMEFEGSTLHWIGSGAEANLKGKSVQILAVDEMTT